MSWHRLSASTPGLQLRGGGTTSALPVGLGVGLGTPLTTLIGVENKLPSPVLGWLRGKAQVIKVKAASPGFPFQQPPLRSIWSLHFHEHGPARDQGQGLQLLWLRECIPQAAFTTFPEKAAPDSAYPCLLASYN